MSFASLVARVWASDGDAGRYTRQCSVLLAQNFFYRKTVSLSARKEGSFLVSVEARIRRGRDRVEEKEALRTCEEFLAVKHVG